MKKTLVIKLCCLGDIVQLTPALRAIKESGSTVHLLCAGWVREITKFIPYIDKVHVFDPGNPFSILNILINLRKEKFDTVINFHRDIKSYWFSRLSGSKELAGFKWKGNEKGFKTAVDYDTKLHETMRYLSVTQAMGIKPAGKNTHIETPDRASGSVDIAESGGIGIFPGGGQNPGTVMPAKRWPAGNFAELSRRLISAGEKVYLFGGDMDKPVIERILNEAPGAVPVITGISDFIYYVSKMKYFIASDTGPLHIAAAAGVNTIGLFGPSSPEIFGARGKNSVNIWEGAECAPCYEPGSVHKRKFLKCRDNICMKKITVEKVFGYIKNKG